MDETSEMFHDIEMTLAIEYANELGLIVVPPSHRRDYYKVLNQRMDELAIGSTIGNILDQLADMKAQRSWWTPGQGR